MHPSTEIERHYAVRIHGEVTAHHIQQLRNGIELEDGPVKVDQINILKPPAVTVRTVGSKYP